MNFDTQEQKQLIMLALGKLSIPMIPMNEAQKVLEIVKTIQDGEVIPIKKEEDA